MIQSTRKERRSLKMDNKSKVWERLLFFVKKFVGLLICRLGRHDFISLDVEWDYVIQRCTCCHKSFVAKLKQPNSHPLSEDTKRYLKLKDAVEVTLSRVYQNNRDEAVIRNNDYRILEKLVSK